MVLIQRAYGTKPRFSYFFGTSQGGREALTVAQRYPADYDGIIANVPIVNFSSLMLAPELIRIQEKPLANSVTPAKVNAIRGEFIRQCDKLDGISDGIINNYVACHAIFDVKQGKAGRDPWAEKRCPGDRDPAPDDTSEKAYLTSGQIAFTDVSYLSRIAQSTTHYVGWGDAFYDFDNDGWLDLIAVNGHVYPQVDQAKIGVTFREPSQLFLNQRDGTFRDVSDQVGAALKVPRVGRGLGVGDLFNDGVQEIVVENLEGEPVILRPEGGPRNHWISFELGGKRSNNMALNARAKVIAGDLAQVDEVRSGGRYLSQSDLRLHFGLGDHRQADKVEISWPSGGTELLTNVAADRSYCVKEGAGIVPCAGIRPTGTPLSK